MSAAEHTPAPRGAPRYGRYVVVLAIVILLAITVNTLTTKPNGAKGVEVGHRLPPFAVPLALSNLSGDADVATRADQGSAGRVPACAERGARILNVCQLYERAPLVLALFVDSGSCPAILGDMQALAPSFPAVHFAGVAIKPDRRALRRPTGQRQPEFAAASLSPPKRGSDRVASGRTTSSPRPRPIGIVGKLGARDPLLTAAAPTARRTPARVHVEWLPVRPRRPLQ